MWDHSPDCPPENTGGCPVVDESSSGVSEKSFSQELGELDLIAEERAGDIDAFASNNNDSLP